MTLDGAIQHCKEKAKELSDKAYAEVNKTMTEDEAYECNECAREHEQLAEWLTELKARREADRWIPVSERLPEKNGKYLVDVGWKIDIDVFDTDGTEFIGGGNSVIAWKLLPEPYKENDK